MSSISCIFSVASSCLCSSLFFSFCCSSTFSDQEFNSKVSAIRVEWTSTSHLPRDLAAANKKMFLYKTLGDGPEVSGKIREWDSGEEDDPEWLGGEEDDTEWLGGEQGDNEKSKPEAPSATLTALPNSEFEGLW